MIRVFNHKTFAGVGLGTFTHPKPKGQHPQTTSAMRIRKLLNLPTGDHEKTLEFERELVLKRCERIARKENAEQMEYKKNHDGVCPNCGNDTEGKIVNKFAFVEGRKEFRTNISFYSGTIDGVVVINTFEVNHCNACGNEWLKYRMKNIGEMEVLTVSLKYLSQILKNPEEIKNAWKAEAVSVFDGCSAETVYSLVRMCSNRLPRSVVNTLTLRTLRGRYGSLYDRKARGEFEYRARTAY